jgi:hypothetical protein
MASMTEDEFAEALRSFGRSAFRVEAQPSYALTDERADFGQFLAGSPTPPPQMAWYRPWVDQVAKWIGEGKTIGRVRVLAEPPTDYQRWLLWGAPWFASIGEDIRYMNRSTALRIGLPPTDWWLLDDERVIVMHFTADGQINGKELVTDMESVASYRALRDLAIENSSTETVTT